MKDNIKTELENIRLDAINELDNFIELTRTVIDSNHYTQLDYANSYIINLYELAPGNALHKATALCEVVTNKDYDPKIQSILSDCEHLIATLTTFYFTSLVSHIEQLQHILQSNQQITRSILTSFLSITQTLKTQLKQI